MALRNLAHIFLGGAALALGGCGAPAARTTYGENPDIVAARPELISTMNAPKVVGWPAGRAPIAPPGFTVTLFAGGLDHPRWLYVLPNGDVLAAQATTEKSHGTILSAARNIVEESVGAIGDNPNNIVLLRDTNGDGVADQKTVFLSGLHQPFGMGLLVNSFYVATTDALLRFPYTDGKTQITAPGEKLADLPFHDGANGHWTRNLLIKNDGTKIYVAVGSSTDHAESGMKAEKGRAAIYEISPNGSGMRVFASGLRNPNGLAWEPKTGALWVAVNERDEIGQDLVPDYMTAVKDGAFYGWPWSYFGNHLDPRVHPKNPDMVAKAIKPDYALGAHTASLGLAFYGGGPFPAHYQGGAFIGQHGSWNRNEPVGYKVIFVPFANGKPSGPPEDFLTGFLDDKKQVAFGRPVGVAVDRAGALYVADDAGHVIWRVTPKH
jgi:glucose/arabinose dehydrogenase